MEIAARRHTACRAPLVPCHCYFELANAIGPGHLIYGIQFADRVQTGKFKEFSSLREMATAILPEFLAHHRDGPICLIGYSFAACLAIELAQHLIGLGKRVPLVVIIDRETAFCFLHAVFANDTFHKVRWPLGDKGGDEGGNRQKLSI